MSQVYAIELYFDQGLENHVLKAWNVLSRRQLSTKLMESGSRPHLTLFSSHFVDIAKLEDILRNFASKQGLLPLSLSSVGILPNENNVLFLGPTPSVALLQFHSQLCDAMKKEGIEIGEDYRPDNWIPYCPVSWVEEVPKNRVAEGVTVLRDLKLPFNGFAIHIAVVEYLPARELFSFSLGTDHVYEPMRITENILKGVKSLCSSCIYLKPAQGNNVRVFTIKGDALLLLNSGKTIQITQIKICACDIKVPSESYKPRL